MEIRTDSGVLRGVRRERLFCFEGIPYARARRFAPCEPFCWAGVRDCTAFGPQAPQGGGLDQPNPFAPGGEYAEDCLNLNIYTPHPGKRLPVVVYLHGGAFQGGSNRQRAAQVMIRGNEFVYVSVNYRLGVLGYLYLGQLLGSGWQATGNLGTLDQLAALEWIHRNIHAFGGDPARVTLMGESAGAKAISALLLLPAAGRCFQQVCLASGGPQSIRDTATAHQVTLRFLQQLGLQDPRRLPELSAEQLIRAQQALCEGPGGICMFGPVADGVVLPAQPEPAAWQGRAIVGSCRSEAGYYPACFPDFLACAPELARRLFGRNAPLARQAFEQLCGQEPCPPSPARQQELWVKVLSDDMYRCYSQRLAFSLAEQGSQVWYYSTELPPAHHCLDQNLAFDQLPEALPDAAQRRVAARIYAHYLQFFLQGDPNGPDLPEWPALCPAQPRRMLWDDPCTVAPVEPGDVVDDFPASVFQL